MSIDNMSEYLNSGNLSTEDISSAIVSGLMRTRITSLRMASVQIPLGIFFGAIFLMSFVGNLLVILAVWRTPKIHTAVNLFFCNLSVSDLMISFFGIFSLVDALISDWKFGEALCKAQGTLLETSYTASIFCLTVVSARRLRAMQHPLSSRRSTVWVLSTISGIWVISLALCSPLAYGYGLTYDNTNQVICTNGNWNETARQVYYTVHTILAFFIPLATMIVSYAYLVRSLVLYKDKEEQMKIHRSSTVLTSGPASGFVLSHQPRQNVYSRRMLVVVFTVVAAFMLLWAPFIVIRLIKYNGWRVSELVWKSSQLIAFANCAVNPIIYACKSRQIRRAMYQVVTAPCARYKASFAANWSSSGPH